MTRTVCGVVIPAKSPTVCLHIEVPADSVCTCTGRKCKPWEWRALECPTRLPEEYAYTRHDLDRVMRSYGHVWALTAARQRSDNRFRLVARGLFSGRVLSTYTWGWNAVYGRYEPEAEPWNLWDEREAEGKRERIPYTLSGFSRLAAGLHQDPGPFVRHKEDVPHEHALPDFYGLPNAA
jgi:hypothetical protein